MGQSRLLLLRDFCQYVLDVVRDETNGVELIGGM